MGLFKKKIIFTVTLIVEPDEDRFHAYCPALKGLHVEGATEDEACKNAADAAIAYLKSLIKHGDPIPLGIEVKEEHPAAPSKVPAPSKCIHQIPVSV